MNSAWARAWGNSWGNSWGRTEEVVDPWSLYQPGGIYIPLNPKKKRRSVVRQVVEKATEAVVAEIQEERTPVSPEVVAEITRQFKAAIPEPVQKDREADHSAIMATINAEISRIVERLRLDMESRKKRALLLLLSQ